MKSNVLLAGFCLVSGSAAAESDWQPVATQATMLAMVLFINLVFFTVLYILSVIKAARHQADLTKEKQQAHYDFLTQVLNRRGFERRITQKQSLQGYILVVDIDDFKQINDRYGHPAGDSILQEVANRLSQSLRDQDIIARYGGEEFVIYASLASKQMAEELSHRLVNAINRLPYPLPDCTELLHVTVSVGVASVLAPLNVADVNSRRGAIQSAFSIADSNLYKAKQQGKNQSVLD
ncbi:GGDEF domain-containing protein [Alteromonas lipolytica]|uniref:diguanylate cyclase n=1 Tax=Alteromonas lipolytica TaxID=1856405 RepID=A0A1E8FHA2_9ALTE|nr:GGDEF domain-containing protein [Alteromonas lipolytica]OFI35301.1 hypothetical protein BFC17_17370 [Alteromonas lipolytica]GGF58418.1 hypothetical protein GCM10011338_08360 [Alteromonas lipolytica]